LLFASTIPHDDDTWSIPVRYNAEYIDPDLFWNDDDIAHVTSAGTYLQTANLEMGGFGEAESICNRFGEGSTGPEGTTYPMGREMDRTNVTSNDGEWPIIDPARGAQMGWYLEPLRRKSPVAILLLPTQISSN